MTTIAFMVGGTRKWRKNEAAMIMRLLCVICCIAAALVLAACDAGPTDDLDDDVVLTTYCTVHLNERREPALPTMT
jgi:hypothetical protein